MGMLPAAPGSGERPSESLYIREGRSRVSEPTPACHVGGYEGEETWRRGERDRRRQRDIEGDREREIEGEGERDRERE